MQREDTLEKNSTTELGTGGMTVQLGFQFESLGLETRIWVRAAVQQLHRQRLLKAAALGAAELAGSTGSSPPQQSLSPPQQIIKASFVEKYHLLLFSERLLQICVSICEQSVKLQISVLKLSSYDIVAYSCPIFSVLA